MFYRMEKLIGMSLSASDGAIGKITDVYFDDSRWAARYLVVDAGGWLEDRRVLISPISVDHVDFEDKVVHVNLSRLQVKDSPDIDTHKPVYRQHEVEFFGYYGYPDYWSGAELWGATPYPMMAPSVPSPTVTTNGHDPAARADKHLRSLQEVSGYQLTALDGGVGHLEDFIVDSQTWALRYIVVDTRNWWPGKHVVIPPQWIAQLDWELKSVHVNVSRELIKNAPEYDAAMEFSREYETGLYRHYQRPTYWH